MMGLCSKLSDIEEIVELTSLMINVTASKGKRELIQGTDSVGINKQFLIDQYADKLLIKLIKESNSRVILANACDALGYLCSESECRKVRFIDSFRFCGTKSRRIQNHPKLDCLVAA
jgi:hypothetical protein